MFQNDFPRFVAAIKRKRENSAEAVRPAGPLTNYELFSSPQAANGFFSSPQQQQQQRSTRRTWVLSVSFPPSFPSLPPTTTAERRRAEEEEDDEGRVSAKSFLSRSSFFPFPASSFASRRIEEGEGKKPNIMTEHERVFPKWWRQGCR